MKCPLNMKDAKRIIEEYVDYYNTSRLHSAINYIAPHDKLNGREKDILAKRDEKLRIAALERQEYHEDAGNARQMEGRLVECGDKEMIFT